MTFSWRFLLSCCVPATPAAWAAEKSTPVQPLSYGNALSVVGGLVLVLALLFAGAWFLRRCQGVATTSRGAIRVVSQLPLGMREKIVLIRVGDENVLVGCTQQSIRALHAWSGGDDFGDDDTAVADSGFAAQVRRLMEQRKRG